MDVSTPRTEDMVAGRYRLERRLARGGMGEVWRAHDTHTERPVAVKLVHDATDGPAGRRLRREARMVASLIHPNVVTVLDVVGDEHPDGDASNGDGATDTDPAIVMELVEGESLADRLAREGALSVEDALVVADAVLAALEAAHARDIVHRDVTPGNVLLAHDGAVKVTDFGIARSPGQTRLTDTGTIVGTAPYLSPEQLLDEAPTPAADQYSAGVVIYEALCGARPFAGESPASVAVARLHSDPVPLRERRPEVPAEVAAVVERALRREPAERFTSVSEMRVALHATAAEARIPLSGWAGAAVTATTMPQVPVTAPIPTSAMSTATLPTAAMEGPEPSGTSDHAAPAPAPADRRARRSRGGMVTIVALVAALAAAAGVAWGQQRGGAVATASVPDFLGSEIEAAVDLAERTGLRLDAEQVADEAPSGTVVGQTVAPGVDVATGTVIGVEVSSGAPACCTVPDVRGLDLEEALHALDEAGLGPGSVEYEESEEDVGTVLDQDPAPGSSASPDDGVALVLSEGDENEDKDEDKDKGPPGFRGRSDD